MGHDPYRQPAPRPEVVEAEIPIPPDSIRWFVQRRRGARGPYSTEQMQHKLIRGLLTSATRVRPHYKTSWRPVHTFPLLAPYRKLVGVDVALLTAAPPGTLATFWKRQGAWVTLGLILIVMNALFAAIIPQASTARDRANGSPAVDHHYGR